MKENRLVELIDESIRLEQNVAELYKVFSEALPEDNNFWWQLHIEEKSHATLIRAAKDSFSSRGKFPYDLIADSIGELREINTRVEALVEQSKRIPPNRREACEMAIAIERESGESHYTAFMEKEAETSVESVFQQLNREDKDHERRIREHLDSLPVGA